MPFWKHHIAMSGITVAKKGLVTMANYLKGEEVYAD